MSRIVFIDFGLKRVGIAISDARRKIAFPFETVRGGPKEVWEALLPKAKEIDKIVIGLPLLMNGEKGEMALLAEKFGIDLKSFAALPVEFFDERLSSKQADGLLREISLPRKERSDKIDSTAAAVMLQAYLDSNL